MLLLCCVGVGLYAGDAFIILPQCLSHCSIHRHVRSVRFIHGLSSFSLCVAIIHPVVGVIIHPVARAVAERHARVPSLCAYCAVVRLMAMFQFVSDGNYIVLNLLVLV